MNNLLHLKKSQYLPKAMLLLAGVLAFGALLVITPNPTLLNNGAFAAGNGSPVECETGSDINGTDDLASYTDPSGTPIDAVCIRSGSNMFGGNQHSGVITQNGDYENGCYTVSGLGTYTVTVTRNSDSNTFQGISHIDILIGEEPEPTATHSATPRPTDTPGYGGDGGTGDGPSEPSSEGEILGTAATTFADGGIDHRYAITGIHEVTTSQTEFLNMTKKETLTLYTCSGLFDSKPSLFRQSRSKSRSFPGLQRENVNQFSLAQKFWHSRSILSCMNLQHTH